MSTYVGHEVQAAEKDTDFQARVHPLFFQVCKAAPGQQQCQQKGADEEKIHVGHCNLEHNGPTENGHQGNLPKGEVTQASQGGWHIVLSTRVLAHHSLVPARGLRDVVPRAGPWAMLQPGCSPLRGRPGLPLLSTCLHCWMGTGWAPRDLTEH